jgi:ABC-2 type transport system ATP-binding protein
VRELVGVQLQEGQLPDRLRVGEALELFASFYRDPADPDVLLDMLGLAGHRTQPYRKLSGGQKQRLSIGLALVGNPRIAVFDELTTGLDPNARRATWRLIENVRARGVTVLLVTHFMEEAERLCDRVAVIDSGRVVALDTPAGVVAAAGTANLDDAFLALTGRTIADLEDLS